MIANFPTDKHDGEQLRFELERIAKECPTFVEWLAVCKAETEDALCTLTGEQLVRQTGAFDALRQIYGIVTNPPPREAQASANPTGMMM